MGIVPSCFCIVPNPGFALHLYGPHAFPRGLLISQASLIGMHSHYNK